jgi:hypothetical protein
MTEVVVLGEGERNSSGKYAIEGTVMIGGKATKVVTSGLTDRDAAISRARTAAQANDIPVIYVQE